MSNELLEKPIKYEVNGEEVKLSGNMVKQYLVSGNGNVTDQEIVMFLQLAKYQKLNPFLNEAYLVKFGSQPAQIIVSKEAFMKRAENHPQYDGMKAGIVVDRNGEIVELPGALKLDKDKLIGGWAKVYRKDRPEPIEIQIELKEFNKGQSTWKSMPNTMIRKTAIVNALREAFPEALGSMYTEDDQTAKLGAQYARQAEPAEQSAQLESLSELIKPEEPATLPERGVTEHKVPDVFEAEEAIQGDLGIIPNFGREEGAEYDGSDIDENNPF